MCFVLGWDLYARFRIKLVIYLIWINLTVARFVGLRRLIKYVVISWPCADNLDYRFIPHFKTICSRR